MADRQTPADLRAIRRTLTARATEDHTIGGLVDADTAFHRAVIVAAHNDILTQLFDTFLPRSRAAMIDMLQIRPMAAPDADHAAHEQLTEAIAARNAAAAATYSRAHLHAIKEAFA